MKAVLKFKYKPRVENGRPVSVSGVRHVITFKLDKKNG
jgi:protein TonB